MAKATINKEKKFIEDLSTRLSEVKDWNIAKNRDGSADLIVQDPHSGKKLFIEFQDGGQYGQLQIASIVSLGKQKSRIAPNDDLLLVSFSRIPDLLASKLNEHGIMAIAKPSSIDDVLGKIQMAMAG
jgi:hypothetical protein